VTTSQPQKIPPTLGDIQLYCKNHPKTETRLRCNKCGEPICIKCARRTPVGFRCPQCLHSQQAVFYTATVVDYVIAAVISLVLGAVAAYLMGFLGWFFAIFLGPIAGGLIAEGVFRAMGGRRGRWVGVTVVACLVLSALVLALPFILYVLLAPSVNPTFWLTLLLGRFNVIYLVLACAAAYARLR
jgi:hypothetical protein